MTNIRIIPAYDHPLETAALFSEYTDMLIAGDSSFQKYLDIQHYDEELAHPETKYGPPYGRLYLAYCRGELAGCIGLRKIDDEYCEMKRLYVRPRFRGKSFSSSSGTAPFSLKRFTAVFKAAYPSLLPLSGMSSFSPCPSIRKARKPRRRPHSNLPPVPAPRAS